MANKILTKERIQQILSKGVKDMPQNPASQGYTKDQIREFYYKPEELILEAMSLIEDIIIGAGGIDERLVSLKEKITGANGLEGKVETLETDNDKNKDAIDVLKEKTKILNVDKTKPTRFLSEDGTYKEIKECECVPIVVDKEINENSTNVVENKAIAKAIKSKQDKLTAGENIEIDEKGVISAEGGSGGTNVEANPTEEATQDLSKLKVGEKVYAIPKEILQGTTAPTTETVGELGQFYTDTTSGTSYQCTSIVEGAYSWVKLIKATDIAQQNGDYGLVKLAGISYGFQILNGHLSIAPASKLNLERQAGGYVPVSAERLAYGVKQALVNPDLSSLPANWTAEEQAKARETLGISGGGGLYLHTFTVYGDLDGTTDNIAAEGYFYSTSQALNMIELNGDIISINASNLQTITSNILVFDTSSTPIGSYVSENFWEFTITSIYNLTKVIDIATEV